MSPRKEHGDRVINALSKGSLPPGVNAWLDNPVVSHDLDVIRDIHFCQAFSEVVERCLIKHNAVGRWVASPPSSAGMH